MNTSDIPIVHRVLKKEFEKRKAPVIELIQAETRDPFKVLVATILSARTKDATTADVTRRLFKVVNGPSDLVRFSQKRLERLIFPTGFFRTKAKHLRELPAVLERRFGGRIPSSIDDLCELPGVGRKTANLVRSVAFDKHAICVDVHVHRICNRLGLLKTPTPFETEMTLRKILPKRYWKTWNSFLVSYGQTICRPVRPQCPECSIAQYCGRIGVSDAHR